MDISCAVVVNPSTMNYLFLRYMNNNIEIFKTITSANMPVELASLNLYLILDTIKVSDQCNFFTAGGFVYNMNNPNLTHAQNVGSFSINNFTDSMIYLVQNNAIFKYI